MEPPNSKQPISAPQSERLPITHYFDRCPPEVTLNILQYADMDTLQRFASIKQFNDAGLAKQISLWQRHIKTTLTPFIQKWADIFLINNESPDMLASLMTRWLEGEKLTNAEYEKLETGIRQGQDLAKKIFKALVPFIKAYNSSLKKIIPFLKSFVEQNFPGIFEINLTETTSIEDFLLYTAVEADQVYYVRRLLAMRANPYLHIGRREYFYKDWGLIFIYAVEKGNDSIISAFINHKYEAKYFSFASMVAIVKENVAALNQLIAAGANVNGGDGFPLLIHAIKEKSINIEVMSILLEAGANLNAARSLLSDAIKSESNNKMQAVKLLLEWGADVNYAYGSDMALLEVIKNMFNFIEAEHRYEIKEEYMTLAKLLIRNGADFNYYITYSEKTILKKLQEKDKLEVLKDFAYEERRQQLRAEGKDPHSMDHMPVKTLVDYINTVGKRVQDIIKGSQIQDIFDDEDKRGVREKLMAVLQYYTNPGKLSVGSVSFSFSRFSFHSHSHATEVQELLKTLANLGEKATAQECYDALKNTLDSCQKKPGYDPDGTLALLGELLLPKLKREIGKETLAAREAAIKQSEQDRDMEEKSETTEQASSVPTIGKK